MKRNLRSLLTFSIGVLSVLLTSCSENLPSSFSFDDSNSVTSSISNDENSSEDSSSYDDISSSETSNSSNSSSEVDPYTGDYYKSITSSMNGTTLIKALASIVSIDSTNRSYEWSRYEAADEALDDSNSILCLYTRHNIQKSSHCGSYSWNTWNREHIWTQSKYPSSKTDNHNIFACEGQINNYRGNLKFGEVEHTSKNRLTVFGNLTDCYRANSIFEPCDEAKGEVARSVLYGVVMYDYTLSLMLDVETALKWNIEHPVTERDIKRNDTVYALQKTRNPFSDHPEYACRIWGSTNSTTKQICGM